MFSLTAALRRAAQLNPAGDALRHEGRSQPWRTFPDRVARLAGGLAALGVEPGDRVAVLALNSDYYYEFYFAVAWVGGVFVPINTRLAGPEIVHWLSDSESKVLCVDEAFAAQIEGLRPELPLLETVVTLGDAALPGSATHWEALATAEPVADAGRCNDDLAGLFYTGGTTGRSKGVMLSQQNLLVNAMQAAPILQLRPGDRCLHVAPMFHIADWCMAVGMLLMAGTNYFLPAFEPEAVMATIEREKIQRMLMVPTMINRVVHDPTLANYNLQSLEGVLYGASPMPEAVIRKALEALPSTCFYQAYGQTEAAPILTMLAPEYHTVDPASPFAGKLTSAGQAIPGVEVTVLDENDQPVPPGTVGEVCARGPNVMLGYRNLPEQTAKTLASSWLHTGDGGRMDEDGFLHIVDRVKDMIISGGENVYSAEVENVLMLHPAVDQCAVIGIPDADWGEKVHAIVVPSADLGDDALDETVLISHCRAHIAGFKVPRSITFQREPLPLSGAGKILKTALRAPYWEGAERQVS